MTYVKDTTNPLFPSPLNKVQNTTEMQTFGPLEDNKETGATKFDSEKPMMQLFPLPVAESISKVLTFGAQKYAAHGWKKLPDAVNRYQGALLRHLAALQAGEEFDEDSGLPHIWHVGANIVFLIHKYDRNREEFMNDIKNM